MKITPTRIAIEGPSACDPQTRKETPLDRLETALSRTKDKPPPDARASLAKAVRNAAALPTSVEDERAVAHGLKALARGTTTAATLLAQLSSGDRIGVQAAITLHHDAIRDDLDGEPRARFDAECASLLAQI